MKVNKFKIEGLIEFIPNTYKDSRGEFTETYNQQLMASLGLTELFVQDNQSISHRGVFRGIHLQEGWSAQGKLVRVSRGSVIDFAVDLRKDSPTYGQWQSLKLTADLGNQFYVPAGFGHAFLALEDNTTFCYKCTNLYDPISQVCIKWDDEDLNLNLESYIDGDILISPKDLEGISLKKYTNL